MIFFHFLTSNRLYKIYIFYKGMHSYLSHGTAKFMQLRVILSTKRFFLAKNFYFLLKCIVLLLIVQKKNISAIVWLILSPPAASWWAERPTGPWKKNITISTETSCELLYFCREYKWKRNYKLYRKYKLNVITGN